MTKPDKMHCVVDIKTIGEQVRTRRNLAYCGSREQCSMVILNKAGQKRSVFRLVELENSSPSALWHEFAKPT